MERQRKKGPSCLGTLLLLGAVLLGLKLLYDYEPGGEAGEEELHEESTPTIRETVETEDSEDGSADVDTLYHTLLTELQGYATRITVDYDCSETILETFGRVCADHPELFWLNGSGSAQKTVKGNAVSVTLYPKEILSLVEILAAKEKMDRAAEEILAPIDPAMGTYDKIRYVHDALVDRTEYDTAGAEAVGEGADFSLLWKSSSAYGCLAEGKAVCSGYAAAFQLLLTKLEIPCIRVSGYDKQSGVAHEWNCVKLGRDWYYVDVTWDDPLFVGGNEALANSRSYEYFMIPEETLLLTHVIEEGQAVPICDREEYAYYRYYGMELLHYSYEEAAKMIASQLDEEVICLRFSSNAEAEKAVQDLFDGQTFYEIPGVREKSASSVAYSVGKNGLLRIAFVN